MGVPGVFEKMCICWVEYSININYVKLSHSVVQVLTLMILSTSRNYNLSLTIQSVIYTLLILNLLKNKTQRDKIKYKTIKNVQLSDDVTTTHITK